MDLREYEQIKFRLAEILRSVSAVDSRGSRQLDDASDEEAKAAERALMVLAGHRRLKLPAPRRWTLSGTKRWIV